LTRIGSTRTSGALVSVRGRGADRRGAICAQHYPMRTSWIAETSRGRILLNTTVTRMQQGRGGMGSHKHGVSGRAPRSPRYKFMQTLEDNRRRAEETKRRRKPKMAASFDELFGKQ
jgi:hypothetical protein